MRRGVHWHAYVEVSSDDPFEDITTRDERLTQLPESVLLSPDDVCDWIATMTRTHARHDLVTLIESTDPDGRTRARVGDERHVTRDWHDNLEQLSRGSSVYTHFRRCHDRMRLWAEAVTGEDCWEDHEEWAHHPSTAPARPPHRPLPRTSVPPAVLTPGCRSRAVEDVTASSAAPRVEHVEGPVFAATKTGPSSPTGRGRGGRRGGGGLGPPPRLPHRPRRGRPSGRPRPPVATDSTCRNRYAPRVAKVSTTKPPMVFSCAES